MQLNAPISVGSQVINPEQVFAEAQYHPAPHFTRACYEATRALVIKALLLEAAVETGILPELTEDERQVQQAIALLTRAHVPVPDVEDQECREFYEAHSERFTAPELTDASHILFTFPEGDAVAQSAAKARASQVLEQLLKDPSKFERVARENSACPSGANGGRLGQLSPGETVPEFEAALRRLNPGQIARELVVTRHGYHVVMLNQRAEGERLPFESVLERIRIYLRDARWRHDVKSYVKDLASRYGVSGFDLEAAAPEQEQEQLTAKRQVSAAQGCGSAQHQSESELSPRAGTENKVTRRLRVLS